MPTVLAILAEGFEEIEAITPIDLLRRAGVEVTLATLGEGKHVTGRCGLTMHAETSLPELSVLEFDCVFLPGGPGVKHLRANQQVLEILRTQNAARRMIAAICAAPTVLHDAGLLKGRRFTAHVSVADELPNILVNERVVVDGNILTSRGAGTALDFGLAMLEQLCGKVVADTVAESICA